MAEQFPGASVFLYSPQPPARWSYFCSDPIAEFKARCNEVGITLREGGGGLQRPEGKPPFESAENPPWKKEGKKQAAEGGTGKNASAKKKEGKPVVDGSAVTDAGKKTENLENSNPLGLLEELFNKNRQNKPFDPSGPPFQGGAIGFLSYEALHYLEDVPLPRKDDVCVPWLHFLFFDSGAAYDHLEKRAHIFGPEGKAQERQLRQALEGLRNQGRGKRKDSTPLSKATASISMPAQNGLAAPVLRPPVSNFTKAAYLSAVKAIRGKIRAGETFQANLSQRFEAETTKPPQDVFAALNKINPSPYSALFKTQGFAVVSNSPELLFSLEGGRVVTRPIKGTRPRGATPEEDLRLEEEMASDAKERAENAMIVDLERNDLGKVCSVGSVRVTQVNAVEKYSHVQHLVSEVEGTLRPEANAFDAIRALFPGGSITGCPKVRTMQILRAIEPCARGSYTGSLGWIGWNGDAAFNILIRTIYFRQKQAVKEGAAEKGKPEGVVATKIGERTGAVLGKTGNGASCAKSWRAYFHAGGGIVWDSVPEREYEESLQKAEAMKLALLPYSKTGK